MLPAVPASLVGSVAVLALGTSLEWIARKFGGAAAKGAAKGAARAIVSQALSPAKQTSPPPAPLEPDAVDELVYIRRTRIRR
jgi:hypothetical protein